MSKIKNIIFDLDGTLWDSREEITKAWKNIVPDIDISTNDLNSLMGKTSSEYIEFLFPNVNKEYALELMKKCEDEEVKYLIKFGASLYKNIIQVIKDLSKSYKLFIVSNCQAGYIESFLIHYNLSKFFIDIECNGNTNMSKEDNIKLLMNRNNLNSSQTCYIGDTQSDYQASTKNNILFIWCKYGFGNLQKYQLVIDSPDEIKNLIETLN